MGRETRATTPRSLRVVGSSELGREDLIMQAKKCGIDIVMDIRVLESGCRVPTTRKNYNNLLLQHRSNHMSFVFDRGKMKRKMVVTGCKTEDGDQRLVCLDFKNRRKKRMFSIGITKLSTKIKGLDFVYDRGKSTGCYARVLENELETTELEIKL